MYSAAIRDGGIQILILPDAEVIVDAAKCVTKCPRNSKFQMLGSLFPKGELTKHLLALARGAIQQQARKDGRRHRISPPPERSPSHHSMASAWQAAGLTYATASYTVTV